jgi:hypothetical protein
MRMREVISSTIDKVGYNNETKRLVVLFLDERVYLYGNGIVAFPKEMYKELIADKSPGSYLHRFVKGVWPVTGPYNKKILDTL